MATFTNPFGKPEEAKRVDDDNTTPQQKRFEKATGRDSDNAVGPVKTGKTETSKKNATSETDKSISPVPKGLDADTWKVAEDATLNMLGGFSGVGDEGREKQIRERYDQIVANNKQVSDWAGEGGIA